jgi:hypothetical protein
MSQRLREQVHASIERLGLVPFLAGLWVMVLVTIFLFWALIRPNELVMGLGAGVLGLVGVVFTFIANSRRP